MGIRSLGLAMVLLAALPAHAGTVLETTTQNLVDQTTQSNRTLAQDGKLRVEQASPESYMLFKDETVFTVNGREKTYVALDRAALLRMVDQISPAMKQMEERMAKLPPEQRAQMQKMMGGSMPGAHKQRKIELRKTSRSESRDGRSCNYVERYEDGVKVQEYCVVPPASLAGSQDLVDASRKLAALMKDILKSSDAPWLAAMAQSQATDFDELGGMPLLSRQFRDGKAVSETALRSIRSESLPATTFDLPAGYTRKEMGAR